LLLSLSGEPPKTGEKLRNRNTTMARIMTM